MTMDEKTLEAISGDIQYEMGMLVFAANENRKFEGSYKSAKNDFERIYYKNLSRVTLESFLLHARSLGDFLTRTGKSYYEDNACAKDYVENPLTWHNNRPKIALIESEAIQAKLNKLLSHISYDRAGFAQSKDVNWDVQKMKQEILEAWKSFIESLPPNRVSWFSMPEEIQQKTIVEQMVPGTTYISTESTIP